MNFKALLPDLAAIDETRQQMYFVRAVLKESIHHYAKEALQDAQFILEVAQASGPMVDTYASQHSYRENTRRVNEGITAANMISQGLLNLEETTDPEIDDANEEYKVDTMDFPVVSAMLEGAMNRLNMATASFPDDPRPGARCNGSIYTVQKQSDSDGEAPPAPDA